MFKTTTEYPLIVDHGLIRSMQVSNVLICIAFYVVRYLQSGSFQFSITIFVVFLGKEMNTAYFIESQFSHDFIAGNLIVNSGFYV